MLSTPFFTEIDPRARIKGSRDPLGLQPIWTRLGRRVIHNLTTVTTSVRNFTTLLLGLYFAERAVEEAGCDIAEFSNLFLKIEQLAAYSRVAWGQKEGERYNEDEVRGIERVAKNLSEGRIRISASQEWQILSNQKTYGIWGLYTVAARNSGWIQPNTSYLSAEGREFVEKYYLPRLPKQGDPVFSFLQKDQYFEPKGKDSKLGKSLYEILAPSFTQPERDFYHKHLIASGGEFQENLWRSISMVNKDAKFDSTEPFSVGELVEVIKQCRSNGNKVLVEKLEDLQEVESVIAPAGRLFVFLLSRDGMSLADVSKEVRSTWGRGLQRIHPQEFARIMSGIDLGNNELITTLSKIARTLEAGEYQDALNSVIEQNQLVMKDRGADAWVRLKSQRIDVRLSGQEMELPSPKELPDLWDSGYFINSLKKIGFQIWSK